VRILIALAAVTIATLSGDSDRATAMITVAGGAHAGTLLVRNTDSQSEITEQNAPRPKHQFEASIGGVTPTIEANTLTLLMLIIPNADIRGPIHSFFTSISFGEIGRGTKYTTDTRPGEKISGSGTVTLVPHGQDATVTFDVTSADGVSYTGTIQCSGVSRY
jgi:hypothetical protein